MTIRKFNILLWGILLFCPFISLKAADLGPAGSVQVTGMVLDSSNQQALYFANVTIHNASDKKPVGGAVTDENGSFTITNIPQGQYYIEILFIGYTTKHIPLDLSSSKGKKDLGKIMVSPATATLGEVTVTGDKALITNKPDRIVYNADKDITSQAGTATDVLKKVPQVSVDVDGNVELLGNSNVRVFINGKPSTMFDNNLAEALQSIPANQIKSIEVMTNPGAKYDAEGSGGIINIILKNNNSDGIGGNISLTGGTLLQNGSLNLHARKGPFSINAGLGTNFSLPSTALSSLNRTSYDSAGNKSTLIDNSTGTFQRKSYRGNIGLGWELSKNDNITANFSYNNFGYLTPGTTTQDETINGPVYSDLQTIRISHSTYTNESYDWNLNYKKKFKTDGQDLSLLYIGSYNPNTSSYQQYQQYKSNDSTFAGTNGNSTVKGKNDQFAVDYNQPFSKKVKLSAGAKATLGSATSYSNYSILTAPNEYTFLPSQQDSVTFAQQIYAAYANFSFSFTDWDIKIGARDELTRTQANFGGVTNVVNPQYNTFLPSGLISRKLKNNQGLKLSFSSRIDRPGQQLNPFVNTNDPSNLSQGNPRLLPENQYNLEFAYSKFFAKGASIFVSLYAHRNFNDRQNYVATYETFKVGDSVYKNVAVTTPENVGTEQDYGVSIYGGIPLFSALNIHGNIVGWERYITGTGEYVGLSSSGYAYKVNINADYQFKHDFAIEFSGNFNSPRHNLQGTQPSFSTYSFAARKFFYNRKASLAFTTTDPFNQYVDQPTVTNGPNFSLLSDRKVPFRSFGLNLTYNFGKTKNDGKDSGGDQGDDEL